MVAFNLSGVNSSIYGAGLARRNASSLNSMKQDRVFSEQDTHVGESSLCDDEPSNVVNETQQHINTNMQGVTPT